MHPLHRPPSLAGFICAIIVFAASPCTHGQAFSGWATGSGHSGQLGPGVPTNPATALTLATGVATAAVGSAHTVWVKTDGTLWALGGNTDGQLGTGDTADRATAVEIPSTVAITAVAAGRAHTLLLKADATLWAVGDNAYGQLGLGDTTDRHTPVQIASEVASIAAGDDHTLFVKIDGSLWTCGRNTHGQLGDGSTTDRATPSLIATGVTSASGGAAHSLFIKTGATLWACGQSTYGQLGTGTTNLTAQPIPVQVATSALRAYAGTSHSLLIKTDGTVHATGDNFFGQFGNGTQSRSYSFKQIGSGRSAVAAGLLHSLFITSTGALLGSGDNLLHQLGGSSLAPVLTAQTLATGVSAVFTRDLHSVWLTTDGTLFGLGDNRAGQLGVPASTTTLPLSLGADITAISQGVAHTLYLKADGSLWALGDNTYGQLGLGDNAPRSEPVQITTDVSSVSAGSFHTLFVKTDGTLWATGRNDRGQLGNSSTTDRTTAVQITTGVLSASAGASHSLFLKTDSTLWGMGDNSYSQTNPNGSSFSPVTQATQVALGVTAFTAGGAHSLYVSGGKLYALGNNSFGQLGTGTTFIIPPSLQQATAAITTGVTTVSTAYGHTLFLKTDGTLWGMGDNSSGQLGLGDTTARLSPTQIASDVTAIAAGGLGQGRGAGHSLFAKGDGSLWAMGDNRFSQLGDGTRINRLTPVSLATDHVVAVVASDLSSAFIQSHAVAPTIATSPASQEIEYGNYADLQISASGGSLSYQWFRGTSGDTSHPVAGATSANLLTLPVVEPASFWVRVTNEIASIDSTTATITPRARPVATVSGAGALGYGAFGESFSATRVGIPIPLSTDIAALAHSSGHSLIIKHDGTLWALGFNSSGQLGTGDTSTRATPVQIASSVAACAAGGAHSLFLKNDGTLWGMGDNSRGQLGDGTTTSRNTPVQIASSVRAFAVGSSHTWFVKTDNTLWACGLNTSGQLGDGSTTNRTTPVQIASDVASIAAGSFYSLFLKIDATLWATGANSVGQLGDGTTTNRATPALITTGVASCSASSSGTHSLFITTDGSLFGMGENNYGRLGLGDTVDRATPALIDTRVTSCSAGADHSLWIKTDQSLWGAGNGEFGQLGLGVASAQVSPREIAAGVSQAFASSTSSHFFDTSGVLRGMGRNHLGQLFTAPSSFSSPIQLAANVTAIDTVFARQPESRRLGSDDQIWSSFGQPGDADPTPGLAATGAVRLISSPIFKSIGQGIEFASGPDRLLFLRADGSLWGAGDNSTGALGTGDTITPAAPVQIAAGVSDASAAGHGTILLKTDGSLWITGQLRSASGGGLHVFGLSPVQIDTDVRAIASSHGHVLYLKTDDSLWGIGDSVYRQLGVVAQFGSMISSPVRITGDVVRFTAGQRHTLLVKRDGTLWACGLPGFGQLGINSNSQGLSLTQITTDVADVVTTAKASFIIKTDGTVWATGRNAYGQLGTSNTTDTSTFIQLFSAPGRPPQPLTGVAKIIPALSGEATFFLKTDGTVLGTGRNDRGQLGLGHTDLVNRPTLIRAQAYAVAASGLHTLFLHEPALLTPPAIVSQPTSQTVLFASFATLSIDVSGGELLTYQWYQGASGDTSRPVIGATDSTLRLPAFAGTASYWARVTNPAGAADTNSATLTVTDSGTPAFRAWAESASLSGSRLSVTADADGDGLANLLEYAFATAPDAAYDRASPTPELIQTGEGAFLVLTHRRLKDAALAFVYETSSDLSSWAPESLTPTVIDPDADNDGRVEEVVVALPLAAATPPRFLRVRVSTP